MEHRCDTFRNAPTSIVVLVDRQGSGCVLSVASIQPDSLFVSLTPTTGTNMNKNSIPIYCKTPISYRSWDKNVRRLEPALHSSQIRGATGLPR
jgi:hypothetical protein